LALIGDLNGNHTPELVVGAPGEDRSRGTVYVLDSSTGQLIERLAGAREGDRYGTCLLTLPDQNGDRVPDLAIGVPGDSGRGAGFGSVRVLSGSTRRALRSFFGNETGCEFGASLAIGPDANGDRYPDLLIGQPSLNQSATPDHGRVQLCSVASGEVLNTWDGQAPGDFYGSSLCGGFDWNRDGANDFAIGIPWAATGPANALERRGLVEVRSGRGGQLLARLEGPESARLFGYTLALAETGEYLLVGAPGRPALKRPESNTDMPETEPRKPAEKLAKRKLPKGHVALFRLPQRRPE
jgi:FG-GAP repeat